MLNAVVKGRKEVKHQQAHAEDTHPPEMEDIFVVDGIADQDRHAYDPQYASKSMGQAVGQFFFKVKTLHEI